LHHACAGACAAKLEPLLHCLREATKIKKLLFLLVLASATALQAAAQTHARVAEDRFAGVAQSYLVKRDGRVLWAHSPQARMAPASLAKMMTALLVLERGDLNAVVTVSRAASRETGSRIRLKAGEQLRVLDLLAATIVASANDGCRALADYLGPSDFVLRMNQRAAALKLEDTHFIDPCGHDRRGQYSSAEDLARLGEQVMQHPEYERLAGIRMMSIRTLDGRRRFWLSNTNALVGRYDGVIGVKTGTTWRAGNCLVAIAEKNGVRVLIVLLNARDRWFSAASLLDRAFEFGARATLP
jgi:serine-type D-Ala-D-Ala carboxypeptidase (penicillin-binding protein 5/6)